MDFLKKLNIKIFADGADADSMVNEHKKGYVSGFTTNPTLMKKDGVEDYERFAKNVLSKITDLPVSFEVFSDDFDSMEKEAMLISSWGKNVYVKIPITNTKGESSLNLIKKLSAGKLNLNITAILTVEQVKGVSENICDEAHTIVSVFAGRIADTGRDPVPVMKESKEILKKNKNAHLLWASSRELLNIFQAEACGCDIITVTNDIIKKFPMVGKDLTELSLDTVKMFYNDASSAGYKLL